MKKLIALFVLFCLAAHAQLSIVTYTLTVTNQPTNGESFTVQGNRAIFTNLVANPLTQILSTNNVSLVASNVLAWLGSIGNIQATFQQTETNIIVIRGNNITASLLTNWATLTSTTQGVGSGQAITLPITNMPALAQTNLTSLLVQALNSFSQSALNQTSTVASQLVGTTNIQSVSNKTFYSSTNVAPYETNSIITNAAAISGTVAALTGGYYVNPITTNAANSDASFTQYAQNFTITLNGQTSPTFQVDSNDFGFALFDPNVGRYVIKYVSPSELTVEPASGGGATFYSTNGIGLYDTANVLRLQILNGVNAFGVTVIGGFSASGNTTNITGVGETTLASTLVLQRFNNSGLANGFNQEVQLGTNCVTKLSGPTAAFSVAGFTAPTDDQFNFVQNSTAYQWTINNANGFEAIPANRIFTGTGADVVLSSNSWALFKYDASVQNWILLFASGAPSSGGSGSFSGSFTGNGGGLTNVTATGVPVVNQGTTNVTTLTSFTATFSVNFADTNYTALAIGNGFALAGSYISAKTISNCVFNMTVATGTIDWVAIHK